MLQDARWTMMCIVMILKHSPYKIDTRVITYNLYLCKTLCSLPSVGYELADWCPAALPTEYLMKNWHDLQWIERHHPVAETEKIDQTWVLFRSNIHMMSLVSGAPPRTPYVKGETFPTSLLLHFCWWTYSSKTLKICLMRSRASRRHEGEHA